MRHLLFLLLVAVPFFTFGQSSSWSADVEIEMTTRPSIGGEDRCVQLLRRPNSEAIGQAVAFSEFGMGPYIMKAIVDGRMTAYRDKQLSRPVSKNEIEDELGRIDTVVLFDPATFEETVQIVRNLPEPDTFDQVGLSIRLTYQADGRIDQQILYGYFNFGSGDRLYFPIENTDRPLKFKKRKWNMIEQHMRNVPVEELSVSANSGLKTDQIFDQILTTAQSDDKNNFVLTDGSFDPLTDLDREMIGSQSVDTVVTYDPDTYEQSVKIVETRMEGAMIKKLRLVQYWAWDDTNAELTILPIGYSPIFRIEDQNGKFLYDLPIFYRIEKRFRE